MTEQETQEYKDLTVLYEQAWSEGIWIKEFGGTTCHMSGAGFVADLEEIEKRTGKELDVAQLTLGDCVEMSFPGTGPTRIDACRDAIDKLKASGRTRMLTFKD